MAWYNEKGNMDDAVLSTRARLARNISGFPFPSRLSPSDAEKVIVEVQNALLPMKSEFEFLRIDRLSENERVALVEKHMISPTLTGDFPRAVFISRDGTMSIMVNEEDHLRIQCIVPGLDISAAYDTVNKIDDLLNEQLKFAFDEKYGYLTCCPTNMGTGLRVSCMMHLPAINMTGGTNALLSRAAREGIAIRGIYGEGSEASGNLFQISNQVTLGCSEDALIKKLSGTVDEIHEAECDVRKQLALSKSPHLTDKIMRAYGAMRHAFMMSADELLEHINYVKLGIYMGIIKDISCQSLTELMVTTAPANLAGKDALSPAERDILRAKLVKTVFGKE